MEKVAKQADNKLLKEVDLFDVYEGKGIPDGKRSYALSFILQDENSTLNDKIIDKTMNRIQSALEKEVGAELRG
jgi:phenylalanyl-tRNA synthetase beta chain